MNIGQLDRRVTIQSRSVSQDAYGEPLTTWADVATVWAGIADVNGREFLAAGGTQNAAQTKITIRHLAGIVPAMRVVHGPDVYNIIAVLGQDRVSLLLMCQRGASNG